VDYSWANEKDVGAPDSGGDSTHRLRGGKVPQETVKTRLRKKVYDNVEEVGPQKCISKEKKKKTGMEKKGARKRKLMRVYRNVLESSCQTNPKQTSLQKQEKFSKKNRKDLREKT